MGALEAGGGGVVFGSWGADGRRNRGTYLARLVDAVGGWGGFNKDKGDRAKVDGKTRGLAKLGGCGVLRN